MVLIFLTRIILTVYGFGLLAMFIRLIGLIASGQKRNMGDIITIMMFPVYLITETGRLKIESTLTGDKK